MELQLAYAYFTHLYKSLAYCWGVAHWAVPGDSRWSSHVSRHPREEDLDLTELGGQIAWVEPELMERVVGGWWWWDCRMGETGCLFVKKDIKGVWGLNENKGEKSG